MPEPMHDHGVSLIERMAAALGLGLAPEWHWLVLPLAMLGAGLAGSVTHCAGMCGPFVLGQVEQRLTRMPLENYGGFGRLQGPLALPYHLGRAVTYTFLGSLAGGLGGGLSSVPYWPWLMALMLGLAALLFLFQTAGQLTSIFGGFSALGAGRLAARLGEAVAPLMSDPTGFRGLGLGLILGFLPCGLLYAALAAAAGTGSAAAGAMAMAAFVLGTMPGLMAVGFGGARLLSTAPGAARWIAAALYAFNGLVLALLALRALAWL